MVRQIKLVSLCVILSFGCGSDDTPSGEPEPEEETVDNNPDDNSRIEVTYEESTEDFANPDRGFYRYSEARASYYTVLDEETLRGYRVRQTSSGSTYQTINTLIFRYYILDDFTNSPISQQFLNNMQLDFDAVRNAGVKMIPRFVHTTTANSGDCETGFICPPYGDAPKDIVLSQIAQLGPVLTENADVINCIQIGFIGTWGENYYTDYFGDASSNSDQGKLLDENWNDRIEVLKTLLDVTPKDLMVQVRYPQMKQRYVYGVDAATNAAPLNSAEAFLETDKARIGFHNDCLFASADDFGTYTDYGNSATESTTDITNLKSYFAEDSKYVIVGGETCSDGYSPENDCAPAGIADEDLRYLHYTFLNADYNNEVNNDWVDGGCMDDIKRNLGYRFVLKNTSFSSVTSAGSTFDIKIDLENIGYTSPVKPRNVKLILRSATTNQEFDFDTDIRTWFSEVSLTGKFTIPTSLENGDYELLLKLEDFNETIKHRSEYSIRFANQNVWEATTGYNNLNATLSVE